MKDLKVGTKVTINKLGLLNGQTGEVISSNEAGSKVDLGAYGTWFFVHSEILLTGKQPSFKDDIMPWEKPETANSIDNLKVATKPAKRPYKKSVKVEPKKEKRKYTKKIKS